MPVCIMKACKNNTCTTKKNSGITFHKLPSDMTCKKKWIKAIQGNRNDAEWLPSQFTVVCSVHFRQEDKYITKNGYCRIKKEAIPKKIHFVNSKWCEESEPCGNNPEPVMPVPIEECNIKVEIDATDYIFYTDDDPSENTSKIQDHTEDIESDILDSEEEAMYLDPEKYKLRQQVKKYKLRCKENAKRIKTLNRKIDRFKKRNVLLKAALKKLKGKK